MNTDPPPPPRVKGPPQVSGTGIVNMHVDDNDTAVDLARIAAAVEDKRIAARQAMAMWTTAAATIGFVVGVALYYGQPIVAIVVVALAVSALAVYLGRSFMFSGLGVKAGTSAPPADGDASG